MGCCSSTTRKVGKVGVKTSQLSPSSLGEQECARVLTQLFPRHSFQKCRPAFLRHTRINPVTKKQTKRRLELDLYNEELQLAVEYNGIQHYKFTKRFHRTPRDLKEQQERDRLKLALCEQQGITLIVVPYNVKNIEAFIIKELKKHSKYARYMRK